MSAGDGMEHAATAEAGGCVSSVWWDIGVVVGTVTGVTARTVAGVAPARVVIVVAVATCYHCDDCCDH